MAENREQYWAAIISEQEDSGQNVRTFCRECGVGEHCFYMWRKRLRVSARRRRKAEPMRFALVEAAGRSELAPASLELLLPGGERLRIERGVDAETLRIVWEALRA